MRLTTATSVVTVQPDEENKSFSLAIEDRSNGYPRHNFISLDFVTSPDYRTLLNSYREVRYIKPPITVVTPQRKWPSAVWCVATSSAPPTMPTTHFATVFELAGAALSGNEYVQTRVAPLSTSDADAPATEPIRIRFPPFGA